MRKDLIEQKELLEKIIGDKLFEERVHNVQSLLIECIQQGGKLLIAGNGGSASQASHFAAELMGRFERERAGLPAIALNSDSAIITAWSNDYSYEDVFARQLQALGREGDVFIGLSTSGNSKNIIKAVEYTRTNKIASLCILGKSGGLLKGMADMEIIVPHQCTARVQEVHLMLVHIFSAALEIAEF